MGLITKGIKKLLGRDEDVFCLDCGGICTDIFICQNKVVIQEGALHCMEIIPP